MARSEQVSSAIRRTCASHHDIVMRQDSEWLLQNLPPWRQFLPDDLVTVKVFGFTLCRDLFIIGGPYSMKMLYNLSEATYYQVDTYRFDPPVTQCCQICGKKLWSATQGYLLPIRSYISCIYLAMSTTSLLLRKLKESKDLCLK